MTKRDDGKLSRRDTLKLASAVSALGVGLGVTLEPSDAEAAPVAPAKLAAAGVGQLSIKFYKLTKDGSSELVQTFDLAALTGKAAKDIAGNYTIKLYNIKLNEAAVLLEDQLELAAPVAIKQAPIAPAPIAPAPIKR